MRMGQPEGKTVAFRHLQAFGFTLFLGIHPKIAVVGALARGYHRLPGIAYILVEADLETGVKNEGCALHNKLR